VAKKKLNSTKRTRNFFDRQKSSTLLVVKILLTIVAFSPSLTNGWVNWDDENYVLNIPLVIQF
jgi:hypothetical protein